MNIMLKSAAVAAGAFLALGLAAPANALPNDNASGVAECIDQLYGNATNARPSGHGVLPSQSPGPWVNEPTDPDSPTRGRSLGQLIQDLDFTPNVLRDVDCS